MKLEARDRELIRATEGGLPVSPTPYRDLAASLAWEPEEILSRLRRMQEAGVIRRVALVPNHYQLGFTANGMTVWDVPDSEITRLGQIVGSLEYVTHCYQRPRHLPTWPYNLFAMVHAKSRDEVFVKAKEIHHLLGPHCRHHEILFSRRILKKTGFRTQPRAAEGQ